MKVELSPMAAQDIATIRLFLEDAGSLHVDAVIEKLLTAYERLAAFSARGAMLRLRSGRRVRCIVVANHLIVYDTTDDVVRILRILHAHRDLRDIFGQDDHDGE